MNSRKGTRAREEIKDIGVVYTNAEKACKCQLLKVKTDARNVELLKTTVECDTHQATRSFEKRQ